MLHRKVTLASSPLLLALLWQLRDEPLAVCTCISALAGLATWCVVPATISTFKRAGLSGTDLAKPGRPVLAESMGVVAAMIYLVATFLFIPAQFRKWLPTQDMEETASAYVFPYARLGDYLSALLSLQSMVFLGFADDVLDLRWRFKLILPTVASVPILTVYYVGHGVTHVVVPVFLRPWLAAHTVELGALYYLYIGMMAVFCTNAINILAGINGVEVGQSIVIALSIIAKDVAYIASANPDGEYRHLFTLYLLLPFVSVSAALYYWNVHPARVFVGDTYCYFAGMTFAVCGILGHFSKTLMLFFVPQVFNFIYSAPQIFGLVPCPRHRLPKMVAASPLSPATAARIRHDIDAESSSASAAAAAASDEASDDSTAPSPSVSSAVPEPSTLSGLHKSISTAMTSFARSRARPHSKPRRHRSSSASLPAAIHLVASRTGLEGAKPLGLFIISVYERLGIADVERNDRGQMVSVNNLTLLNLVLVQGTRLTEAQLNNRILLIQILNSALAFLIRYRLSHLFYF
ncbi:tunicamycin resistance protein [Coemansia sp. RSA 1933]|nr:tunicamycin resistance protein [Coemansia sp. RSA 1933]